VSEATEFLEGPTNTRRDRMFGVADWAIRWTDNSNGQPQLTPRDSEEACRETIGIWLQYYPENAPYQIVRRHYRWEPVGEPQDVGSPDARTTHATHAD
jgi:hypothetical protein